MEDNKLGVSVSAPSLWAFLKQSVAAQLAQVNGWPMAVADGHVCFCLMTSRMINFPVVVWNLAIKQNNNVYK